MPFALRAQTLAGSTHHLLAMSRATVRTLKRSVRTHIQNDPDHARQSALSLLERSMRFGHGRLSVLRLRAAVDVGAQVPQAWWAYCARAAGASQDAKVQGLYREAALLATQRPAEAAA
jgi:hypothetical protein